MKGRIVWMGLDRAGPYRSWNGIGNLKHDEEPLEDFLQERDTI